MIMNDKDKNVSTNVNSKYCYRITYETFINNYLVYTVPKIQKLDYETLKPIELNFKK